MRNFSAIALILFLLYPLHGLSENSSKLAAARAMEKITWYSEQYPPFNYLDEDGVPGGMAVDILMEIFKRMDVNLKRTDIKIVPWNQSYQATIKEPNTALFSTTRTEEREDLFKFVGPISPLKVDVIALRANRLFLKTEKDLNFIRTGVVTDDIGDVLLTSREISDEAILRRNALKQILYQLVKDNIDAVAYEHSVFFHVARELKLDPRMFEVLLTLKESTLGYAFNKTTDDSVLKAMQATLDEMTNDGTIAEIHSRY